MAESSYTDVRVKVDSLVDLVLFGHVLCAGAYEDYGVRISRTKANRRAVTRTQQLHLCVIWARALKLVAALLTYGPRQMILPI